MKWLNRFCILFVLLSICLSLCLTSSATELVDSSEYYVLDPILYDEDFYLDYEEFYFDDLDDFEYYAFAQFDEDNPLPVILVDHDIAFADLSRRWSMRSLDLDIGSDPPSNPLFYGSCWVSGYDSNLGNVTIYFPLSAKEDTWGVDSNGYLFNINSGSVSGYLDGVYNNSVSASGFAYPRYRISSGAGSQYIDLHLVPSNSNMEIATFLEPAQNVSQLLPYVYVVLLGVIVVCFMKRF